MQQVTSYVHQMQDLDYRCFYNLIHIFVPGSWRLVRYRVDVTTPVLSFAALVEIVIAR